VTQVGDPSASEIATLLIDCQDRTRTLPPITRSDPSFDVARAYEVLALINARREAQGWSSVGRKIGFTNRTIWERYGVYQPMWAPVWSTSVRFAVNGRAKLPLGGFVQPRIEPEVVFKLAAPPPAIDDADQLLQAIDWIAPGFEVVHSVFPDWKFAAPDCTAASGLHGALVVGAPIAVTTRNRSAFAAKLPVFELALTRNGALVERGVGSNVLGSPVNALAHLVRVLAGQPQFPSLSPGEIVTTGTITDAWPIAPGETWTSDYGTLGLEGLTLEFA